MIRLLQLEYTKFKNHSLIIILLMLYGILAPTIIFLAKEIRHLPPPLSSNSIFFKFTTVWDYLGYIGSWLSFLLLGLLAVYLVVNEVSYKTFRQNIITGLTRREFFLAKLYTIIVISAAAALLYLVVGFGIGAAHTKDWTFGYAFDHAWAIPRYFLMTMGFMSFGLLCGFVFRRSGIAILFYLTFALAIDPGIKWLLHSKVINHGIVRFTPFNSFEDLMPFPLYRFVDFLNNFDWKLNYEFLLTYPQAILASIFWTGVFLYLSYRSIMHRDL